MAMKHQEKGRQRGLGVSDEAEMEVKEVPMRKGRALDLEEGGNAGRGKVREVNVGSFTKRPITRQCL